MNYQRKYSFVVPIFNDGYLAASFCEEFQQVFRGLLGTDDIESDVELIFVDDGSRNETPTLLQNLYQKYGFVRVIELSRNFGQHVALLCGYRHARGRVIGRLNVDMQDPPREIPLLLVALEQGGCDIVVGIQRTRHSKLSDIITSRMFFAVFNMLVGSSIPHNTATLRVMTRRYVDALLQLNDKTPFMQGLENWVGFTTRYIQTDHQPRIDKKSAYTFMKRLKLAVNAAVSFSDRPLTLGVYGGSVTALAGFIGITLVLMKKWMNPEIAAGWSSLICILLFFAGVQMLLIGLIGNYLAKVLLHVQGRPLFIVKDDFMHNRGESSNDR